jgi:hypothetical protein
MGWRWVARRAGSAPAARPMRPPPMVAMMGTPMNGSRYRTLNGQLPRNFRVCSCVMSVYETLTITSQRHESRSHRAILIREFSTRIQNLGHNER